MLGCKTLVSWPSACVVLLCRPNKVHMMKFLVTILLSFYLPFLFVSNPHCQSSDRRERVLARCIMSSVERKPAVLIANYNQRDPPFLPKVQYLSQDLLLQRGQPARLNVCICFKLVSQFCFETTTDHYTKNLVAAVNLIKQLVIEHLTTTLISTSGKDI